MSSYLPPHVRNKQKYQKNPTQKPKTPEIKITKEEFPELIRSSKKNDTTPNLKKSFAEIAEKEEKQEVNNNLAKIKAGWIIIKRDEKSNIVILDSKETIETKERLSLIEKLKENDIYFNNLNRMIENWNYFRDVENELRGDLSPYYYYKEELEEMRKEDLIYAQRVDEFYHNQNNSDSDDEETNRNLIY
tara:strand:- start:1725 stop:2291 length:567 start_codon:yes stop_codon:yes gene_type:complete